MDNNPPGYEVVMVYPKDFPNKEVNEPFIKRILSEVLKNNNWEKGDPNKGEPDYFCDGMPFEFTLASDSKRKNNFIQRYFSLGKSRGYSSDNVEQDVFSYISERIEEKAKKNYSVENVNLCVLCLLDMINWVSDFYGSYTHVIADNPRKEFFKKIRNNYIEAGVFNDIYLLFPDMTARWWVYEVMSEKRASYSLTDEEIIKKKLPFEILKSKYDEFLNNK